MVGLDDWDRVEEEKMPLSNSTSFGCCSTKLNDNNQSKVRETYFVIVVDFHRNAGHIAELLQADGIATTTGVPDVFLQLFQV